MTRDRFDAPHAAIAERLGCRMEELGETIIGHIVNSPDRYHYHEADDCSVTAVVALLGIPYGSAHAALRRAGREPRRGVTMSLIYTALDELGWQMRRVRVGRQPNGSRYTLRTIAALCDEGRWLIETRDHVAALCDGVLYNERSRAWALNAWSIQPKETNHAS